MDLTDLLMLMYLRAGTVHTYMLRAPFQVELDTSDGWIFAIRFLASFSPRVDRCKRSSLTGS